MVVSKKSMIWVTAQKEMIHNYPDAPNEVDYLRNLHRHIFHFKVYIAVEHNDRDVEFIMFKHYVEGLLEYIKQKLLCKSCEMMADFLYEKITVEYPNREVWIEVSEDGENGCFKQY